MAIFDKYKDLIKTPEWKESYNIFKDYFSTYNIEEYFDFYLNKILNKKRPSIISKVISRIKGELTQMIASIEPRH